MNRKIDERRAKLTADLLLSRVNLLFFTLICLVDAVLLLFKINFPLHLMISKLAIFFGMIFGKAGVMLIVFGFLMIFVYGICWLWAKKNPFYLRAAQILLWIDAAINLCAFFFNVLPDGFFDLLINLLFHVYMLFMISKGSRAVKGLDVLPESVDENSDPYEIFRQENNE